MVRNLKMLLRITLKLQVQNTRFQHLVKVNSQKMTISYSDYKAEDGKLKSVYLSFETKDGDTFYLTYKSGPDED